MQFLKLLLLTVLYVSDSNAQNFLHLATTTSIENSGLLSVLNPIFEQKCSCRLHVLAVGTGKALKLGKNGDVDVVFVHAPQAEINFVNAGYGLNRVAVMHNDFVLVGVQKDLAGVKQATSITDALQKITNTHAEFISRNDDSGTHKKERLLWKMADINPMGSWYIRAGQGMATVLKMADEKQAYTLTDRGTYLSLQDRIELTILFANTRILHNPYHIIAVNPKKHPHVQYQLAQQYIDFVTSREGQNIIATFKIKGQTLFYPDATPLIFSR